jgi:flavin-dependent dehydrogenase
MGQAPSVVIIGAGPAGSIAGALLADKGYAVTIVERSLFPRFSIGESLLPQCMEFIQQAGMLHVVEAAGFQLKTGAAFLHKDRFANFCFSDKFTAGFNYTYQVQRDRFDTLLAQEAQRKGVEIRWQQNVVAADFSSKKPILTVEEQNHKSYRLRADFVLDASGFGRVLPRLLNLEIPSSFPPREALFTHLEDRIDDPDYDRNKILITVHPKWNDVWYWLIPFSNGRSSIGVVGEKHRFKASGNNPQEVLKKFFVEETRLSMVLKNALFDTPVQRISGYSSNVRSLHGNGFALLGNAAEFLDPVFSSGVTIAMKSASLAADVLDRQFTGRQVNWQADFAKPLQKGVQTFRVFVRAWYDGSFQDVVFFPHQERTAQLNKIKRMICSVLAGYAWDEKNPYVKNPSLRMKTLVNLCREPGWQ